MTELLLRAVVDPTEEVGGESQKKQSELWWKSFFQLSADDNPFTSATAPPDFSDDGRILYTSGTGDGVATRDITLSEDVHYLFSLPNVNVEFNPDELRNAFPDELSDEFISDEAVKQLVTDVADTIDPESLFVNIEGVALSEERDLTDFRQATGPFTIDAVKDNAFAPFVEEGEHGSVFSDGYWVGIDTAVLPSFEEGITIDYGGTFESGESLDSSNAVSPLEPVYEDFKKNFEEFSQEVTLNLTFDLNKITDDDNGDDVLRGTNQRDLILGSDGNDILIGRENNDNLRGGNGSDTLNGTNPGSDHPGRGEIDILNGGDGPDTFVLGDGSKTYYLGEGHKDYAIIEDFQVSLDKFQLGSNPDDYVVNGDYTIAGESGAGILRDDDLVAIVKGVSASTLAPVKNIDFDEGNLPAGTVITDQFEGLKISTSEKFGVMIFDTNNPTGGDDDLGAGIGNALIISEDGDSSDPDDNAAGGTISIEFDQLVAVTGVGLLDIDEPGGTIKFFDDDSDLIKVIEIPAFEDGNLQQLNPNVPNVALMEINLAGSAALTELNLSGPLNDNLIIDSNELG